MVSALTEVRRAPAAVQQMADAARRFLDGLDDAQRAAATFPFDGDERYFWHYTPVERNGLQLKRMTAAQRTLAFALMATGLSTRGYQTAREIIELEPILGEHERLDQMPSQWPRDPERYWFSIFGTPGSREPWAWRVGGHHIGLCLTIIDGDYVAPTPLFFGANPAKVRFGPKVGHRTLVEEEDLARALVVSLDATQRGQAVVAEEAPRDLLTTNLRSVDPAMTPVGIAYSALAGDQRGTLIALIRHYVTRTRDDLSASAWQAIERAGFEGVTFAWAGPLRPATGHYYVVKSPRFMIEYDNTQNDANHIHSVWREFEGDWGEDLLAAHYQEAEPNHGHHHA
jgi:hypothetical protein